MNVSLRHRPPKLACPACGDRSSSLVIDTRPAGRVIRRRRECRCGHRFTTHETVVRSRYGVDRRLR